MKPMDSLELHKLFKALSNERRLKLFQLLYDWCEGDCTSEGMEKCFTRACAVMNLSRSTISHHFKELQNAGLITCKRNGQSFVCRINMEAVHTIRHFLNTHHDAGAVPLDVEKGREKSSVELSAYD